MITKNAEYARRFPSDQAVLNKLADLIVRDGVTLAGGDALTVSRLQSLGIVFGMSYGFADIHYLLETALEGEQISRAFLAEVQHRTLGRATLCRVA